MANGKTTRLASARRPSPPTSYWKLIRRFPLRPIQSEAELDRAIAVVNDLIDKDKRDRGEEDYLDVLADLVHKYEQQAHPINHVAETDLIRFLMDQQSKRQADVSRATGIAESTFSEVLNGKRRLTRSQLEKLARYFHVHPGVFLAADVQEEVDAAR